MLLRKLIFPPYHFLLLRSSLIHFPAFLQVFSHLLSLTLAGTDRRRVIFPRFFLPLYPDVQRSVCVDSREPLQVER